MTGESNSDRGTVAALPYDTGKARAERRFAKLPPLNLFRVFEAAARHRSFRNAAEELCVTPSAVSQQIRQLEDFLNVRLFRRLPRRVDLTREGTVLADVVQETLMMLSQGCSRLIDPAMPTVLCLNASSSLASRWLIPQLKQLMEQHPRIKITLLASNDPIDFKRQDIDVAIRWGDDAWPTDIHRELLAADFHFPVCSPDFRDQVQLRALADLRSATILHEVNGSAWASWFQAAGTPPLPFHNVLYFSDASLMLEAAVQGQGVCLSNYILAGKDLEAGRLVKPFAIAVDLKTEGYYILSSQEFANRPDIATLREWLCGAAVKTVARCVAGQAIAACGTAASAEAPRQISTAYAATNDQAALRCT